MMRRGFGWERNKLEESSKGEGGTGENTSS
jgi:hypothetical protein